MELLIRRGSCCLLTILLVILLQAQDGYCEEISKEFKNEIVKLLKITGAENIGIQMSSAITNQIIDSVSKENSEIPQRAVEAIKDEINKLIREEMPRLMAEFVPVYAKHYTQQEIMALIAFYETPLGKKSIIKMPLIMNEGMQLGQVWGQSIAERLDSRIEARLKKEGL